MRLEGATPNKLEGSATPPPCSSWAAAAPVARALDLAPITSAQYYERRLGRNQDQVDYLAAFSRSAASALRDRLARPWSLASPQAERWDALTRLVTAWADGRSLVSVQAPTFWLEFDDHAVAPPFRSSPSVSVCLVPGYRAHRLVASGQNEHDFATASDVLGHLQMEGEPITGELEQCFERLPDQARWIHLSVMLGRTPCAVKLYGTFPRDELLPYLSRIGWCGDPAEVQDIMADLYGPAFVGEQVFVDLNLDTYKDPRRCSLGLAVAQQHLAQGPIRDPDRRPILDRWIAAGIVTERAARGVREWAGATDLCSSVEPAGRTVARFLDLKLVWQVGQPLLAKAYLGGHGLGRIA